MYMVMNGRGWGRYTVGRREVHVNERKGRYTVGDSTLREGNYRMKDKDRDRR